MRRIMALLGMFMLAAGVMVTPAGAQGDTVETTIVHGVPDLPVDIYVDGLPALEDVAPMSIVRGLQIPSGRYQIDIRPAGSTATSAAPISAAITVPPGATQLLLVAHLDATGAATLRVVEPDISAVEAGKGRVVVSHLAAAGAVDVLADSQQLTSGLAPGSDFSAVLSPISFGLNASASGTTTPLFAQNLPVSIGADKLNQFFIFGRPDDGSLNVVSLTLDVDPTVAGPASGVPTPLGVPTGTGGLIGVDAGGIPIELLAVGLIGMAGIAVGGSRAIRVKA